MFRPYKKSRGGTRLIAVKPMLAITDVQSVE